MGRVRTAEYRKLATVLDTLPDGFPATDDHLEIRILEKIFEPDQAELLCDLRLVFESAEQIAERTGRPLEGLEEKRIEMTEAYNLKVFGPQFFSETSVVSSHYYAEIDVDECNCSGRSAECPEMQLR